MTMVRIHECFEDVKPLMEVIRELEPEAIIPDDDERIEELHEIRETALNNDYALDRLCSLKPEHRESYMKMFNVAEEALDRRAAKLGIECL